MWGKKIFKMGLLGEFTIKNNTLTLKLFGMAEAALGNVVLQITGMHSCQGSFARDSSLGQELIPNSAIPIPRT